MERREHPSMEEYASSNPYITDSGVPVMPLDGFVADGFRPGGGGPRLPMVVVNPYITNTTETTADMAVTDGYFNGRPHQQLPVVHLPGEDPVKTAMPEPTPREQTDENGEAHVSSARSSQEDDRQTVFSRVSFGSERSTLPPSYTSRPMSRRVSYDDEERGGDDEHRQSTEVRPLIMGECLCRHPQCISCVANGTALRDREERCSWRKRLRCTRGCTRGGSKKKSRKFRFCCASIFFLVFTWTLFGGLVWKHAANRFKESMEYINRLQCDDLLPGTYEELFTVPINTTLSTFSLRQSVVYEKPRDNLGTRINVDGIIYVEQSARDDQNEGDEVKVKVEYKVTDETVLRDINIKMTDDGIGIHTNAYTSTVAEDTYRKEVCVFFKVTVKFPKHASAVEISRLLIDTEQLAIQLRPSLSLKVLDKALLNSITGNILSEPRQSTKIQDDEKRKANFGLRAKHLLIGTTTGNIDGVWGLADSASFESKSGNIDIGVNSVTSLSSMSAQTDFSVTTVSGDVAIHSVSTDGALHPFRDDLKKYNTVIRTISGSIIGQYLLGSSLSIQSISGDIKADILPISPAGAGSTLEDGISIDTDTKSGKTRINFLEATDAKILTEPQALLQDRAVQTVLSWIEDKKRKIWQLIQKHCADQDEKLPHSHPHPNSHGDMKDGHLEDLEPSDIIPLYVDPEDVGLANLAFFKATHTTVSGEVFVHYSGAFEGSIKASTLTGDIEVGGENVRIVRNSRNGPVGRIVEAVHGNSEDGLVESKSISGDIRICIGDARW